MKELTFVLNRLEKISVPANYVAIRFVKPGNVFTNVKKLLFTGPSKNCFCTQCVSGRVFRKYCGYCFKIKQLLIFILKTLH